MVMNGAAQADSGGGQVAIHVVYFNLPDVHG